jgi:hypothetical protein
MKRFDTVLGRHSFRVSIAALALAGAAQVASASLIDVNFYSAAFGGSAATGAAVVGGGSDIWNGFAADGGSGGSSGLVDVTGTLTSVTLNYDANPGGGAVVSATPNFQPNGSLMYDYLFNNTGGSITVTLGAMAPGTYDLYVYLASNDGGGGARAALVTANSASATATGNPQSTFIAGQNYVLLTPTVGASGILTITEANSPLNASGEVDMNGLQIEPAVAAVPEPTTLISGALLLLPFGSSAVRQLRQKLQAA